MMASYSSVLRGKEEKGFPPTHGFAMEEQKQKKKVQDFNFTGTGCEEQRTDGLKKVKANWGNDSIFGTYGLSEHSSSSGLSSPFGSELGSTETDETESEEDEDFIVQLTRQMADYMLKDDEEEEEEDENDENRVLNSTPYTVQVKLYLLKDCNFLPIFIGFNEFGFSFSDIKHIWVCWELVKLQFHGDMLL